MKTCLHCALEITGDKPRKFCSSKCLYKYWTLARSPKFGEVDCTQCGAKYKKRTKINRFCSNACKDTWWKGQIKAKRPAKPRPLVSCACAVCGAEFVKKHRTHKYCSRKCNQKMSNKLRSKKPDTKDCKVCGITFKPYTSLDKFCSGLCRIESMKAKRVRRWNEKSTLKRMGALNPVFRHGLYVRGEDGERKLRIDFKERLFIKNRKELKGEMVEKYGYVFCEHCRKTISKTHTHHIIYRSEAPRHDNLHDKRNLIILCPPCHNWFHNQKDRRAKLLKERKLWELFDHLPRG